MEPRSSFLLSVPRSETRCLKNRTKDPPNPTASFTVISRDEIQGSRRIVSDPRSIVIDAAVYAVSFAELSMGNTQGRSPPTAHHHSHSGRPDSQLAVSLCAVRFALEQLRCMHATLGCRWRVSRAITRTESAAAVGILVFEMVDWKLNGWDDGEGKAVKNGDVVRGIDYLT
ncbi:uncharacterized protein L3040_009437 [Drepanopeziza brunnea f. sp. 'multigermtubi']|uniref:uncharacterized protein n=1 Tax=Drepanopeziza brunnea f. sp. 'multigermtubi' TaxID=698441 RepID=UPI002382DE3B|nr:hypothetical protein L3040_009437 [Drepanopeziza brunnea f. sp. 'multigermtubi']